MKFQDFQKIIKQVHFTLPDDCLDNIKDKAGCARTYKPTRACQRERLRPEGGRESGRNAGREGRKGEGGAREHTGCVYGEGWYAHTE
jgi:hypothetical protein